MVLFTFRMQPLAVHRDGTNPQPRLGRNACDKVGPLDFGRRLDD